MRQRLGGKGEASRGYIGFGLPQAWSTLDFSYTDPPIFESQATFPSRLNLLLPGEATRLSDLDMMPQLLPKEWWPKEDAS